MTWASVRPSIRLSITLLYCAKTVQARITKSLLRAAPRTLVYHDKISCPWVKGFEGRGFPSNKGVPAGSASVSLPPWLCTWLQIFSACHTSTHVDDCALRLRYRWSLHALCVLPLATALSSDCCIDLEQFAEVSPVIAVVASFSQQTENRTFFQSYSYD